MCCDKQYTINKYHKFELTRERDRAGEAKKSLVEFGFGGLDDMMHAKDYSHGNYEVVFWSSAASRIIINM